MSEMETLDLPIFGAFMIRPKVFSDGRGSLLKMYNRPILEGRGIEPAFVEDYFTVSKRGVLRGLHYQVAPFSQAKLVRCMRGEIFDVMVDMRKTSPTFGKWFGKMLREPEPVSLYLPRGCAHGVLSMTDGSLLSYQADNDYSPPHERSLLWNDPDLGIAWPKLDGYTVSEKDSAAKRFAHAEKLR